MMIKIIAFIALSCVCISVYPQEVDEEMNFLNHVEAFVKDDNNQQPMQLEIEEWIEKECTFNGHESKASVFYVVSRAISGFLSCFNFCWLRGK